MNTSGSAAMERKKVSISSKRQITIPQNFYEQLGFSDEAECILRGNELIIRPVRDGSGGEFAEFILKDLLDKGYSGSELLEKFKAAQRQVRPAVEQLLSDAEKAARGEGEYVTSEDVFGQEE